MEETKKEMDEKFLEYFRNTFFVDRRNLIQKSDENDVDMTYNFNSKTKDTSKSVFERIQDAFIGEKYEELEVFFDKMNLMEEKVSEITEKNSEKNYVNKKEESEEMRFGDILYEINNRDPYNFYSILNNKTDMFSKFTAPKIPGYEKFIRSYENKQLKMKSRDMMEIQNFFSEASPMFNKTFLAELTEEIIRSETSNSENILKSYIDPFENLPRKILFGVGSFKDIESSILKIRENNRLYSSISNKKGFSSKYADMVENIKSEYVRTDFNKIDKIEKVRENFKIDTFDSYVEALDLNGHTYLKEYTEIKPFLDKYNIKKMNRKNIKRLYEDRERLIKDLENKNGMAFQDITKKFILNEEIINRYMENKLKGKTCIIIDDMHSPFFALKVPVVNGEIDEEFITSEFDIFTQDFANKLIKDAWNNADSRTRFVHQLIKTERGMVNLNDDENIITDTVFIKIGIPYNEKIEEVLTDNEKLIEEFNSISSSCIFNNASYEFKSRLDNVIVKVLIPFIEHDYTSRQKLYSYMNKNSVILEKSSIYSKTFGDFYKNISQNSNFVLKKSDLYKLRENKSYIDKMLRENTPVSDIVSKYHFSDRGRMTFILEVFKEKLRNIPKTNENEFNPIFRNSFFEERPSFEILRGKSYYIQKKVSEFSEMIRGNQEKIDNFNFRNQEVFDTNFENVIKNEARINLVNEMEKTEFNIKNLNFFGQNPENIRKRDQVKEMIYLMQNKLTSTMAVNILLRDKTLEKKYQEVLNFTDRFYAEIIKNTSKKNWQVLLRDYYTDRELLINDIVISPSLNGRLIREIEHNLELYNVLGVEKKVKILNNIMSNLDVRKLNRDFFREELRKVAKAARQSFEKNRVELTENNRTMHNLLGKDIVKLEKMDKETKKAVNNFAERFIQRLEGECEDSKFAGRFEKNNFFDNEFISYIVKYENISNDYIRDLLLVDNEGTVAEMSYQNQSFQGMEFSNRFSRYRESMKINMLRKTNLVGKKIYENPEIKRLKNNRKKIEGEIEGVKSKIKEILEEARREYEEDVKNIGYNRKSILENQEKTRENIKESNKITVKTIEVKKEEEKMEDEREHEEDIQKIEKMKEQEKEYVRSFV